uniref:Uncharacterized protein n=1 Tax=Cuerna arida TaxID=1464854 RepID=A0A1B6F249_9HEMI
MARERLSGEFLFEIFMNEESDCFDDDSDSDESNRIEKECNYSVQNLNTEAMPGPSYTNLTPVRPSSPLNTSPIFEPSVSVLTADITLPEPSLPCSDTNTILTPSTVVPRPNIAPHRRPTLPLPTAKRRHIQLQQPASVRLTDSAVSNLVYGPQNLFEWRAERNFPNKNFVFDSSKSGINLENLE